MFAQTTVNVTVQDTPDNQTWNNGSWSVRLVPGPGAQPGPFTITSGGGSVASQSGSLSGSGTGSISLPANANIVPALSLWSFTFCPLANTQGSAQCFSQSIVVNVSSPQSYTATPPSPRLASGPFTSAYSSGEVRGGLGTTYYDLTAGGLKYCSIFSGNACTTWTLISGSGGTGCTLTGVQYGVLSENPAGTCFDSADFTWDDTKSNFFVGKNNTYTGTGSGVLIVGTGNTVSGATSGGIVGNINQIASGNDVWVTGWGNEVTTFGSGSGFTSENTILSGIANTVAGNLASSAGMDDVFVFGNNQGSGGGSTPNGQVGSGGVGGILNLTVAGTNNVFQITSTGGIFDSTMFGHSNSITTAVASGSSQTEAHIYGANNGVNDTSSGSTAYVFGHSNTVSNCVNCFMFGGFAILSGLTNYAGFGLSSTPEAHVSEPDGTHPVFGLTPRAFASWGTCSSAEEGSVASITDSTTNTWGATITGSGADHVLGYCDGTNWTVMAK